MGQTPSRQPAGPFGFVQRSLRYRCPYNRALALL